MPALELRTSLSRVFPLLNRLSDPNLAAELAQVGGRAVFNAVEDYYQRKDATANRLGGKRTHYWMHCADSAQLDLEGNTAIISLYSVGLRLKHEGGEIRPKAGNKLGLLWVPARAAAHGVSPREIPGLFVIRFRSGKGVAVKKDTPSRAGGKADGSGGKHAKRASGAAGKQSAGRPSAALRNLSIFYYLVPKVTLPADPSALPSSSHLQSVARTAISCHLSTF